MRASPSVCRAEGAGGDFHVSGHVEDGVHEYQAAFVGAGYQVFQFADFSVVERKTDGEQERIISFFEGAEEDGALEIGVDDDLLLAALPGDGLPDGLAGF